MYTVGKYPTLSEDEIKYRQEQRKRDKEFKEAEAEKAKASVVPGTSGAI